MADAPSDAIPGTTANPAANAAPKPVPSPASNSIPFPEFSKLDLRIGKILSATPVEGASKLYRLEVDIGTETRTLVGGLVGSYSESELVGRLVAVVCNLERKTIRGVES
ncbi:MAG: methionine--tRNA ligase, partial [Candidatus Micrarchaeota archaeon]